MDHVSTLLGGKSNKNKTDIEMVMTVIAWSHKLLSLQEDIEIVIHWVLGHTAKTPWNKRADLMAKATSSLVQEGLARTNRDETIVVVDSSFLKCP